MFFSIAQKVSISNGKPPLEVFRTASTCRELNPFRSVPPLIIGYVPRYFCSRFRLKCLTTAIGNPLRVANVVVSVVRIKDIIGSNISQHSRFFLIVL